MKTHPMLYVLLALMIGLGGLTLAGCDDSGPAEEAGESIDDTAEDTADGFDDATDDMEDEWDDATD